MPKTVTARFETEEEAERALAAVAAEVPLRDSAVIGSGLAGSLTLDSLHLAPEERAACDQQLSKGGFLVLTQVATEARGEAVLGLLDGFRRKDTPPPPPPAPPEAAPPAAEAPPPAPVAAEAPVEEERIPIVEEELRIGKREVVRGRARVRSFVVEEPVREEVELLHEEARLERRPVNRRLK